ncbi:hypothetical protein SH528x_002253 [Novipirellula sp. SH528]|uniref:hypothetical protein n=1 Tax=Novipirellula sp. SH528 TaxID=3454466 RepID=UPI003FA1030E
MAHRNGGARRGMLLLELVVALVVSSIIIAGLHASLAISIRSIPDSDGSTASALRGTRIVDQLATELETAVYVTERSATTIGFTVPDRDGDGFAERIRYTWTGTPGGSLTRQYNGATPLAIAEDVDLFSLTPSFKSVAETYPTVGIEDANESLLVDHYGTSGLENNDVRTADWLGQHFTMTLPAGAYSWRPTRVQFVAKRTSLFGVTRVQMRPATINLTPRSTVIEQVDLYNIITPDYYTWQSFNFSDIEPLPSGGAICLVLEPRYTNPSATLQSTTAAPGLLKSSDSGTSWSYNTGKSLISRLYGKLTRANGTQSLNSNYLTSMAVTLRMKANTPTLESTVACLNHPELLANKWETNFRQNPTTMDVNGDAAGDWIVNGGGTFDTDSIVDGVWRTSGTQLNTNPNSNFDTPTAIDIKFQNTSVGGNGATFKINALRSGTTCAPVLASLTKQTDGSQTLTLATKSTDFLTRNLIKVAGLPNQPVLLHLIIDPATSSVSLSVNDVQYGTYALSPFASSDTNRSACLGANVSNSEFSYARIRVMEATP